MRAYLEVAARRLALTIISALIAGSLSSPVSAEPKRPNDRTHARRARYVAGQLIVKLSPGQTPDALQSLNARFAVQRVRPLLSGLPRPDRTPSEASPTPTHGRWHWASDGSDESADYATRIARDGDSDSDPEAADGSSTDDVAPGGPDLAALYVVDAPATVDVAAMASAYAAHPAVAYAEPNFIGRAHAFPKTLPNDPLVAKRGRWATGAWEQPYPNLWGLERIQAHRAWPISQGRGVVVAVIDTGVDYRHEDLARNMWRRGRERYGYDFVTCESFEDGAVSGVCDEPKAPDPDPMDDGGHGTHVAGTIAAVGNNGRGVIGVAPQARIMAVRGLNGEGEGTAGDLVNAITYAVDRGARVLNCSWGVAAPSRALADAIAYAVAKRRLVFAAAGNSNRGAEEEAPANLPGVITVGATTPSDRRASFSSWGPRVDLGAPGGSDDEREIEQEPGYNIVSTLSDESQLAAEHPTLHVARGYYRLAGTSMATPHAAGAAALLLAKYATASPLEIRGRLLATTDPYPADVTAPLGTGRLNVYRALTAKPQPFFRLHAVQVAEQTGDRDGLVEAGEIAAVTITLENVWQAAGRVTARLQTVSPAIAAIPTATASYGSVAMGQTVGHVEPFLLQVGAIAFETPVNCELVITADRVTQTVPLTITLGITTLADGVFPPDPLLLEITPVSLTAVGEDLVWAVVRQRRGDARPEVDLYHSPITRYEPQRISTSPWNERQPTVADGVIIWASWETLQAHARLQYYRVSTRQGGTLSLGDGEQFQPFLDGRRLVWGDADGEIYYAPDWKSGQPQRITREPGLRMSPRIAGDHVVWFDCQERRKRLHCVVMAHDLRTGVTRPLMAPDQTTVRRGLTASGLQIAWATKRPREAQAPLSEIYLADPNIAAVGIEDQSVTPFPAEREDPVMHGGHLLYLDARDRWDLYLQDVSTGQERRVTDIPAHLKQFAPAISGRTIFWWRTARRGLGYDLCLTQIPPLPVSVPDRTPPSQPLVADEGVWSRENRVFRAVISAIDSESGIAGYQYQLIQRMAGATSVLVPWTTVDRVVVEIPGLRLVEGAQYHLAVTARNGAGLVSPAGQSDGITIDTVPLSGRVVINGGAAATDNPEVTLTFEATDAGSGLAQVRISNDGTTWIRRYNVTAPRWTLAPGNGLKTVHVVFVDHAGNVSPPVTAQIRLEPPPSP